MYVNALKKSNLPCNLEYVPPTQTKRKRSRTPIYYNPPFSLNVETNIGAAFLKLIDKHFNKSHPLHKFSNRSKIKVSYSTMPNMMKQINKHNSMQLHYCNIMYHQHKLIIETLTRTLRKLRLGSRLRV